MQAAIKIGSGSGALPLLLLSGFIKSDGSARVELATDSVWTPIPGFLQIPPIAGYIDFKADGAVAAGVWNEPIPSIDFFIIRLENFAVNVTVQGDSVDPDKKSDSSDDSKSDGEDTGRTTFKLEVTGGLRIVPDFAGGLFATILGKIDTETSSASIDVDHPGNYCPFSVFGAPLSSFCTPRILGGLAINGADDSSQPYLYAYLTVILNSPINIISGFEITDVNMDAPTEKGSLGPTFGITAQKDSQDSSTMSFKLFFEGSVGLSKSCTQAHTQFFCLLPLLTPCLPHECLAVLHRDGRNDVLSDRSFCLLSVPAF